MLKKSDRASSLVPKSAREIRKKKGFSRIRASIWETCVFPVEYLYYFFFGGTRRRDREGEGKICSLFLLLLPQNTLHHHSGPVRIPGLPRLPVHGKQGRTTKAVSPIIFFKKNFLQYNNPPGNMQRYPIRRSSVFQGCCGRVWNGDTKNPY